MSVRRIRTGLTGTVVAAAVVATAFVTPAAARETTGHDRTQEAIEAAVKAGVPGVVAQARDEDGSWTGTAGVANLKTGQEREAPDRYRVGSITKTFVATVLLQLQAEGRLDLDDTVDQWLPGLIRGNGNDGRRITVRQLLNHTSGIYSYTEDPDFVKSVFGDGFFKHRYDTWIPRQLVKTAMGHKPDFAPGTSWNYSNTNFTVAGMVIEKVTGRSYGKEIERRILKPLELRATSVPGTDARMPRPSGRAYSTLSVDPNAKVHDVTELNPSAAGAAGEMISNSSDLQRFYRALLKGRLLPKQQLKEMMTTVAVGDQMPEGGYGLELMQLKLKCGKEVWGHGGGIHGSLSEALVTRNADHSLAFNFNGDWSGDSGAVIEAEFCK
ncbi:serine hydrolase domain-containing protein [Streptomyces sp. H27-C3]|uniref:serine hydrolase domain-containing protein n=1 Tax=Streptomyces sp. H27-C3 TaxID=3046305 RepID=UPI0024BBA40B|nr:serine hydrolase domain-containing protein [Streptomyces sp. H27-C3]MDJ0460233.1 serine hydrolase domain-containing protein [Streptomyces sp. H27-C3]